MFDLLLKKNISNFHSLEVVGHGSDSQLQKCENLNTNMKRGNLVHTSALVVKGCLLQGSELRMSRCMLSTSSMKYDNFTLKTAYNSGGVKTLVVNEMNRALGHLCAHIG